MAKLLMEIAGAPPQDLTANVRDLFSGPGAEELDTGSDDDAVAMACVADKVVGAVVTELD
jgi:hypothetical protein